jgi:RND superfamily putative drug exporter
MGTKIGENIGFLRDRVADIDTLAANTASVITATKRLENLTRELANGTHISRESAERLQTLTGEARDHLADFDDFFRPLRNYYFHWEQHCYDIPICSAFLSLLETTAICK